jgi:hypothetical protein
MQYNYKTEKLLQDGVDFSNLFSEKQKLVKDMTGFAFDLENIVNFLKKETDNFQKQTKLALDIDANIYQIYLKWSKGAGNQDADSDEDNEQEQSMPTDADNIEAIELMFDLLPDDDTQEAIELMIELLPEKEQAKMKKKLQKALKN